MSWEGLRLVVGVNTQISGALIFLGFLFLFKQSPPTRRLNSKNWFWRLGLAELSGTYIRTTRLPAGVGAISFA
jgi:hypothetical protein